MGEILPTEQKDKKVDDSIKGFTFEIDCIFQEKEEVEESPALMIASMNQQKDLRTT